MGGAIHQFRPMKTSRTTAHSVRTVARLSVVICHQVSGLFTICSTIHQIMSPTPSIGAMNLQDKKYAMSPTPSFEAPGTNSRDDYDPHPWEWPISNSILVIEVSSEFQYSMPQDYKYHEAA